MLAFLKRAYKFVSEEVFGYGEMMCPDPMKFSIVYPYYVLACRSANGAVTLGNCFYECENQLRATLDPTLQDCSIVVVELTCIPSNLVKKTNGDH